MTLEQALLNIDDVAEQDMTDYNAVVSSVIDGYDVSLKVGDLPPHWSKHVDTIQQAESEVKNLAGYTPNGWFVV